MTQNNEHSLGIGYAIAAYALWGVLPLYWRLLGEVPAGEILSHRICWSFVSMLVLLVMLKKTSVLKANFKVLFGDIRQFLYILFAAILISCNWLIYIWAVNNGHVLEASLGYYIVPLVSVFLGVVVLKEGLNRWQIFSFVCAAIGVCLLTWRLGQIPWISLVLALTFSLYGLSKKLGAFDAITGLAFETMMVTPIAFSYAIYLLWSDESCFLSDSLTTSLLLAAAGVVTAAPMLCFAQAIRRISMTMTGFLQYIAPTITMLLGIFIYREDFSSTHALAFSFIWLGLAIFSLSQPAVARLLIKLATRIKILGKLPG